MADCSICLKNGGRSKGTIELPSHKYVLCERHYLEWFKRRLIYSVERFRMFPKGGTVIVGVSGGVDSAVLLFALKDAGFNPVPVHIVLGEGGYFGKSLETARKVSDRVGLALEEIATGPQLVGKNGKNPCATCSELRNFFLNRLSRERKIPVATGHHLDDEAGAVFDALVNFNPDVLGRRFPVVEGLRGFGKKTRPLCLFEKREIQLYAKLRKIPHLKEKCENSLEPKTAKWENLLKEGEKLSPGFKLRLYSSYLEKGRELFRPFLGKTGKLCDRCKKEPASGKVCVSCKYGLSSPQFPFPKTAE